ncbi:secE/sec61-gamma protein [Stachybotrys elegans]|uniref:SecE/sec61-gamma protein n=1 Tax=Stachybotrys elegans TaxID=80388 RepID=A0A8K0WMC8_9HYPO|nr:secE/sec61-gamma protein [Stachybotrys elegans]
MSDQTQELLEYPTVFVKDGVQFVNKCQKPDRKEFIRLSQAVGVGFIVMGAIGYVLKLIHIPLNNILVGAA